MPGENVFVVLEPELCVVVVEDELRLGLPLELERVEEPELELLLGDELELRLPLLKLELRLPDELLCEEEE